VWKNGQCWVGLKTHMGYNQEAYDGERAALTRALETAPRRQIIPERLTIFTDAQAAIKRLASEDPGPGQTYAIQARKHIATFWKAIVGITIKIRWCLAHKVCPVTRKPTNGPSPWRTSLALVRFSDRYSARPMPPTLVPCTPQT